MSLRPLDSGVNWACRFLRALPQMETPGMGSTHQVEILKNTRPFWSSKSFKSGWSLFSQVFLLLTSIALLRVNLIFPILYVLATIVICGLPMIITPVETAIGLAMILSGINVSTSTATS